MLCNTSVHSAHPLLEYLIMENGDFIMENGDLIMENNDLIMENNDLIMENSDHEPHQCH